MLNLKKTALAVIALGSTAAFAGTMGPVCSAVNVTVPCENTAWDLGGRALYLQPSVNAGILNQATFTVPSNATNARTYSTYTTGSNPKWNWGFQLEGSYHFSTGNDFNLNWYHFRGSNNFDLAAPVTVANAAFVSGGGLEASSLTVNDFVGTANSAWDQVNMEFGQHVDFGENKFARFHGGMNFSRVNASGSASLTDSYTLLGNTNVFSNSRSTTASTVYNGFGPRVGMDLNYDWGNGLSVYADGALSVLAGSTKSSKSNYSVYTSPSSAVAGNPYQGTVSTSANNVVGELDGKLGAMYTYAMAQGDLSLDVGWVFANYMNALSDIDGKEADFGIQGLYFGLKWVGNVA